MPIEWSYVDDAPKVKETVEILCRKLKDIVTTSFETVDYLGGVKISYCVKDRQYEHTVYLDAIRTYYWVYPKRAAEPSKMPSFTEEWQTFTWSEAVFIEEPAARYFPDASTALDSLMEFCRQREITASNDLRVRDLTDALDTVEQEIQAANSRQRDLDTKFQKILHDIWGADATYEPPVRDGYPQFILLLIEQKQDQEGSSDTERFLQHIASVLELKNFWVIDLRLNMKTQHGQTASPKKEEKYLAWLEALQATFSPQRILYPDIVAHSLPPRALSSKLFTRIVHPARTTQRRPEFLRTLGEVLSRDFTEQANDLGIWTAHKEGAWYELARDMLLKEGKNKVDTNKWYREHCPAICPPVEVQSIGDRTAKFRAWLGSNPHPRIRVTQGSASIEIL